MNVMAIQVTDDARRVFGEKLKAWREANGMTQQALAEQLGCAMSAISKWERGDKFPRALNIKRAIIEITGLNVDAIAMDNRSTQKKESDRE